MMLAHDEAVVLKIAPSALVFADDTDSGISYILPRGIALASARERPACQLMMLSDTAGFWQMSLRPEVTDDQRVQMAEALTAAAGRTVRLLTAEADVDVVLDLGIGPPVTRRLANWRGTPIAFDGEISGDAARDLARAWERDLPDAKIEVSLVVQGSPNPSVVRWSSLSRAFSVAPGDLRMTTQEDTASITARHVATRTFHRSQALDLPRGAGRATLIRPGRR